MTRFLIRRIGQAILVLWAASVAVFLLFFVGPGRTQVARTFAGRLGTPARIVQIKHALHLDQPLYLQYLHWVGNLLHGNLGYDYYKGQSVNSVVGAGPAGDRLAGPRGGDPVDLLRGVQRRHLGGAVPVAAGPGLHDGGAVLLLDADVRPRLHADLHLRLRAVPGDQVLPFSSYVPLTTDPWQWFVHLLLPWLTLAMVTAAGYTRLTRTSMLEVLGEDYIRTARSKGMSERRVIRAHGLRAALTPVVTLAGLDIGTALGGVIITEQVFGHPRARLDDRAGDRPAGPADHHGDRCRSPRPSW